MNNKISVITVVFNDVKHIRETMKSFFAQTWAEKEYIVIDGGSTDGTVDIIREYADRLAYWCSEPDNGIYDAMNKGISHCTGDWINVLNSGDTYVTDESLAKVMAYPDISDYDIVYGDSVQVTENERMLISSGVVFSDMELCPIYRHGSSLVRSDVQRKYLYRLSLKNRFGFALDWDCIYNMYKGGCKFKKVNVLIETYLLDGISNSTFRTLVYNYRITTQYGVRPSQIKFFLVNMTKQVLAKSYAYRFVTTLLGEYVPNSILTHIPFWSIRRCYLKMIGMHIGEKSMIMKHNVIMSPRGIRIGNYTHINQGCVLDARGGLEIGNSVSISHNVSVMTGGHDYKSGSFCGKYEKIVIEDNVWIGVGAIVLQGVTIGKGAVVCAGAVITKNIEQFTVVGGVPAKAITKRPKNLNYKCVWDAPLS